MRLQVKIIWTQLQVVFGVLANERTVVWNNSYKHKKISLNLMKSGLKIIMKLENFTKKELKISEKQWNKMSRGKEKK